jgi:outer membrane protein insertion porin family
VVFKGCHSISPSYLEVLTGVRKGVPLDPHNNQRACRAVVEELRQRGHPFARCTLAEGGQPGDERVVFDITEGPKVGVRAIEFDGNHFFSGPVLGTHINSTVGGRLRGYEVTGPPYDSDETDLDRLVDSYGAEFSDPDLGPLLELYRGHGFLDAHISRQLRWQSDFGSAALIFHIDKGPRYRVAGTPRVITADPSERAELQHVVRVKAGEYFNLDKVYQDIQNLDAHYGSTGRKTRTLDNIVVTGPGMCAISYEVEVQSPVRVGRIIVVGNIATPKDVILRQVPLVPGKLLNYPGVVQAERNLKRLGLFEVNPEEGVQPSVEVLERDGASPFRDILITVKELPSAKKYLEGYIGSSPGKVRIEERVVYDDPGACGIAYSVEEWPAFMARLFRRLFGRAVKQDDLRGLMKGK